MKLRHNLIAIAAMLVVLAGCASPRTPADFSSLYSAPKQPVTTVQKSVIETALSLLGTPYLFGGTTPQGFDCTGFVGYVYRKSAGMALPRESHDLVKAGKQVAVSELHPTDIVYFKIELQKSLHIGIYLGDGKFIHAPSKRGKVNIQNLSHDYWKSRYLGARRFAL